MTVMEIMAEPMSAKTMLFRARALGMSHYRSIEDYRQACTDLVQYGHLLITPVLDEPRVRNGKRGRAARRLILAPHHIASGYPGNYDGEAQFKVVPAQMKMRIEKAWKHPKVAPPAERRLATHYAIRVLTALTMLKNRWANG